MELEKLLEKVEKLQEGVNDKWNKIKAFPKYKGMTDDQIVMKAAAAGEILPEEIDKLALNSIRKEDLEKAKQAAQQAKSEDRTPENQGNEQAATDNSQNQEATENNTADNTNQETVEQPTSNGDAADILKEFEGKTKISPDDVKAVLADPTKAQQLIDWVKTQNPIIKEVQGLQNLAKQAQAGNAQTADNGQNQAQAKPQRAFNEYFEPLGKLMKTQADVDKAIEYFTNLKNTKPAN